MRKLSTGLYGGALAAACLAYGHHRVTGSLFRCSAAMTDRVGRLAWPSGGSALPYRPWRSFGGFPSSWPQPSWRCPTLLRAAGHVRVATLIPGFCRPAAGPGWCNYDGGVLLRRHRPSMVFCRLVQWDGRRVASYERARCPTGLSRSRSGCAQAGLMSLPASSSSWWRWSTNSSPSCAGEGSSLPHGRTRTRAGGGLPLDGYGALLSIIRRHRAVRLLFCPEPLGVGFALMRGSVLVAMELATSAPVGGGARFFARRVWGAWLNSIGTLQSALAHVQSGWAKSCIPWLATRPPTWLAGLAPLTRRAVPGSGLLHGQRLPAARCLRPVSGLVGGDHRHASGACRCRGTRNRGGVTGTDRAIAHRHGVWRVSGHVRGFLIPPSIIPDRLWRGDRAVDRAAVPWPAFIPGDLLCRLRCLPVCIHACWGGRFSRTKDKMPAAEPRRAGGKWRTRFTLLLTTVWSHHRGDSARSMAGCASHDGGGWVGSGGGWGALGDVFRGWGPGGLDRSSFCGPRLRVSADHHLHDRLFSVPWGAGAARCLTVRHGGFLLAFQGHWSGWIRRAGYPQFAALSLCWQPLSGLLLHSRLGSSSTGIWRPWC